MNNETTQRDVVLIVDDEEFNLDLIEEYLEIENIACVRAEDGEQALALIADGGAERFSAIVLDRMMPGIDGIEVLKKIKAQPELESLPVIMQTAMAQKESMLEGLAAGAHYYLAKPYDRETLATIVNTAIRDYRRQSELLATISITASTLAMIDEASFTYQSVEQAKALASLLANASDEPDKVILGLTELMINAVEHGNLGITYEEKSALNEKGGWITEVEHRLTLTEYRDRVVRVEFVKSDEEIVFTITDQGDGFDWERYIEISPERAFDTHGRGIAMAKMISFGSVEFIGKGNEVRATVQRSGG